MGKEKKATRRSKVKYPALKKQYNSRIRQEYLDMDYIDKLDDTVKNCKLPDGTMVTEKEWLNHFTKEHNNASVAGIKDKTNKTARKKNKLHRTAALAKECTDRNNARNRDTYGIAKAQNMIHREDYEVIQDWLEEKEPFSNNYTEDAVIELLDYSKELGETADDTDDNS